MDRSKEWGVLVANSGPRARRRSAEAKQRSSARETSREARSPLVPGDPVALVGWGQITRACRDRTRCTQIVIICELKERLRSLEKSP